MHAHAPYRRLRLRFALSSARPRPRGRVPAAPCSLPPLRSSSSPATSPARPQAPTAMGTGGAGTTACPFGHPATTRNLKVPKSIDRTGTSNAARALNAFIAKVPNGSVIDFARPGAVYRLDAGLLLSGRRNIVLMGHGSTTLRMHGSGHDEALSAFLVRGSSHVRIRGFKVAGSHQDWPANVGERAHVLALSGWYASAPSHFVDLSHVTASRIFGDGVYLEGENEGDKRPSTRVCIHDNSSDYVGRNGISLINVTDVLVKHNKFDHVGYHAIDIEPNFASEEVRRIRISDNVFGVPAPIGVPRLLRRRCPGRRRRRGDGRRHHDRQQPGRRDRGQRLQRHAARARLQVPRVERPTPRADLVHREPDVPQGLRPRDRLLLLGRRLHRGRQRPADGLGYVHPSVQLLGRRAGRRHQLTVCERVPSRQGRRATGASSCRTWMQRSGSSLASSLVA